MKFVVLKIFLPRALLYPCLVVSDNSIPSPCLAGSQLHDFKGQQLKKDEVVQQYRAVILHPRHLDEEQMS